MLRNSGKVLFQIQALAKQKLDFEISTVLAR